MADAKLQELCSNISTSLNEVFTCAATFVADENSTQLQTADTDAMSTTDMHMMRLHERSFSLHFFFLSTYPFRLSVNLYLRF